MATPETDAKNRIKKRLDKAKKDGVRMKLIWNAGTGYGEPTLDLTGSISGHPVAVEVKRFDGLGKLNARQKCTLREFDEGMANTFVIDSEVALEVFIAWVYAAEPREPTLRHA